MKLIIPKYNTKNRHYSCRCCVNQSHKFLGKIYRKNYTVEMKYIDYDDVDFRY